MNVGASVRTVGTVVRAVGARLTTLAAFGGVVPVALRSRPDGAELATAPPFARRITGSAVVGGAGPVGSRSGGGEGGGGGGGGAGGVDFKLADRVPVGVSKAKSIRVNGESAQRINPLPNGPDHMKCVFFRPSRAEPSRAEHPRMADDEARKATTDGRLHVIWRSPHAVPVYVVWHTVSAAKLHRRSWRVADQW